MAMSQGVARGLLYKNSSAQLVPGLSSLPSTFTRLYGVNAHGDVVGASQPHPALSEHAFLRLSGPSSAIDLHRAPYDFSSARAINAYRQVAGNLGQLTTGSRPFVFDLASGHRLLPYLRAGTSAMAYDLDDSATVVGSAELDCGEQSTTVPVVWSPTRKGKYIVYRLPFPDGDPCSSSVKSSGEAFALNNQGEVAGYVFSGTSLTQYGVVWRRGGDGSWELDEVAPHAVFYDVSETGIVVGAAVPPSGPVRAIRFEEGDVRVPEELAYLDKSWVKDSFFFLGVNSIGDIVGHADRILSGSKYTRAIVLRRK